MKTRRVNQRVGAVASEPERISWESRAATANSSLVNKAYFAAHLERLHRVDKLLRGELDVLSEQVKADHVEDEPHDDGFDKKNKRCWKTNEVKSSVTKDRLTTTYLVWFLRPSTKMRKNLERLVDDKC